MTEIIEEIDLATPEYCVRCKHFLEVKIDPELEAQGISGPRFLCKAYPDLPGIPIELLFRRKHDRVEPGQEGEFVFESSKSEPK